MGECLNYKMSFYLQAFISACPAVLIIALCPSFLLYFQGGEGLVGEAFFLVRLGIILGGLFAPYALLTVRPHILSGLSELLCSCVCIFVFYSFHFGLVNLFIFFLFIRFALSGVIGVSRFTWLKSIDERYRPQEIFIFSLALIQSTYAVAGILYLFDIFTKQFLGYIIWADAITSMFGAYLFFSLKEISPKINTQKVKLIKNYFNSYSRVLLIAADIFLAVAISGTNYLLVEYGEKYFGRMGGYGLTLIIYAFFYFIGGQLMTSKLIFLQKHNQLIMRFASIGVVLGFLMFALKYHSTLILIIAFSLVFISYPIALLAFEKKWFQILEKHESASAYSYRLLILSSIWAFGELMFSSIIENDNLIRLSFALLSFLLFQLFYKEEKVESRK